MLVSASGLLALLPVAIDRTLWPASVALVLASCAVAVLRMRASILEIGPAGLRYSSTLRMVALDWGSVASVDRDRRTIVVRPRSRLRLPLRLSLRDHGPGLLDALRDHAPPGTIRIREDEELELRSGLTAHPRARWRGRAPVARPRRASYRETHEAASSWSLWRVPPPERSAWRRAMLVSIALGAALFGSILMVAAGQPLGIPIIVASLAVSTLVLSHVLGRALELRALRRALRARIGAAPRIDPRGMLVSACGTARMRQLPADLDDPVVGPHLHVEALDGEGMTVWSTIVVGIDLGLPAHMRPATLREAADVRGPGPQPLERGEWQRDARTLEHVGRPPERLLLEHGPDGAILKRFGRGGRALGDTFHEDAIAARAQAAREVEHDAWRDAAADDEGEVALAPAAATPDRSARARA